MVRKNRLKRVNWLISVSQDRTLDLLSNSGRAKSEYVRMAIDLYFLLKPEDRVCATSDDLLEVQLWITEEQYESIEALGKRQKSKILRDALATYFKKIKE